VIPHIRTIKHEFFVDENLAEVSFAARLLFQGLWVLADRCGRLEDRPKRIKAMVFPYDEVDVDQLLAELADHRERFIVRYEVEGLQLIQVRTFERHQRPNQREPASALPCAPVSCTCKHVQARACTLGREQEQEQEGKNTPPPPSNAAVAADSPADAGSVLVLESEAQGLESPAGEAKPPRVTGKRREPSEWATRAQRTGFEAWWGVWPNKAAKSEAERAWCTALGDELRGQMPELTRAYLERRQMAMAEGMFVPHLPNPATFLRWRRWEDQFTAPSRASPATTERHQVPNPGGYEEAAERKLQRMIEAEEERQAREATDDDGTDGDGSGGHTGAAGRGAGGDGDRPDGPQPKLDVERRAAAGGRVA
jgi:hypothetical protein